MNRLTYAPGMGGDTLSLDCRVMSSGAAQGLRSYEWDYDLGAHSVIAAANVARSVSLRVDAQKSLADALITTLARDVEYNQTGTLTLDGWHQRAVVPKVSTDEVYRGHVTLVLSVVLLDGYWWREVSKELFAKVSSGGLDYPHDHPHDLGHSSGRSVIHVGGGLPAPTRITFRGPCTNPYVIVAGNRYEVDVSVPSGSMVVLDSMGTRPTAILYDQYGNGIDKFSLAVRDGGQGGGSYAYEPFPAGSHEVTWSGGFGMELAWREREVSPPWTR